MKISRLRKGGAKIGRRETKKNTMTRTPRQLPAPVAVHPTNSYCLTVASVVVLYVVVGTGVPAYLHSVRHGFSALQVGLAFFLVLNVLICLWEIALGRHVQTTIPAEHRYLFHVHFTDTNNPHSTLWLTVADALSRHTAPTVGELCPNSLQRLCRGARFLTAHFGAVCGRRMQCMILRTLMINRMAFLWMCQMDGLPWSPRSCGL